MILTGHRNRILTILFIISIILTLFPAQPSAKVYRKSFSASKAIPPLACPVLCPGERWVSMSFETDMWQVTKRDPKISYNWSKIVNYVKITITGGAQGVGQFLFDDLGDDGIYYYYVASEKRFRATAGIDKIGYDTSKITFTFSKGELWQVVPYTSIGVYTVGGAGWVGLDTTTPFAGANLSVNVTVEADVDFPDEAKKENCAVVITTPSAEDVFCVCKNIIFAAWKSGDCEGEIEWSGGELPPTDTGPIFITHFTNPGIKTVTASVNGASDKVTVNVIGVEITSADVCQDKIHVDLKPSGLSATLKLEIIDPDSHTIREVTRASGSCDESFNIPNLAEGEYKKVKATWTVGDTPCSDEYAYHIRVLGEYNHTCYNTVDESGCSGPLQWFSYTIGDCLNTDCVWHNAQGKAAWLDAITHPDYGTGSGRDENGNIYSREYYCTGNPYSPRFRRTGQTCPYCVGTLAVGDVAIQPGHEYLRCGNQVFVYQHGVHTVRDRGSGVVERQLDHYYGISGCGECPSIGDNIMTIQISFSE